MSQHDQQQSEGRDRFSKPLRPTGSHVQGGLQQRQLEHRMRKESAGATTDNLNRNIEAGLAPGQHSSKGLDDGDRGVEMSAADGPEEPDQGAQHSHRRAGVGKQGDRSVTAGKPLGHDPGAYNGGGQEQRADPFGGKAARQSQQVHCDRYACCSRVAAGTQQVVLLLAASVLTGTVEVP